MKTFIFFGLFVLLFIQVQSDNWAVLVAGSNTYANYRHQSDVFHSYQILIKNKFNPDRIITFAYDDVANNVKNPFKGKVFNKPTYKEAGVDVYSGVKIDYKGANVDPNIFIDVLLGNKTAVKGKGTERVLESTSSDNVFIYFADHGAPGLIAFPSKYLHSDQLLNTFDKMKGKYGKLVFYLQACQSGSMFQKLPNNTKIYGLSAANPSESSWGYYCSPDDVVGGKHIGSCLGDLFSINFLEDTESVDVNAQNLEQQFQVIKRKTTKSHVMQWGDLSFQSDKLSTYFSSPASSDIKIYNEKIFRFNSFFKSLIHIFQTKKSAFAMDSRYIKVRTLSQIYARQKTEQTREELFEQMRSMQYIDNSFVALIEKLNLDGNYNVQKLNNDCMRAVLAEYEGKCGKLTDYGLLYGKYLAQACENHEIGTISNLIKC